MNNNCRCFKGYVCPSCYEQQRIAHQQSVQMQYKSAYSSYFHTNNLPITTN